MALPTQPNNFVQLVNPSSLHCSRGGDRSYSEAPLKRLTVDLIKTYRHINEVRMACTTVCTLSVVRNGSQLVTVYFLNAGMNGFSSTYLYTDTATSCNSDPLD